MGETELLGDSLQRSRRRLLFWSPVVLAGVALVDTAIAIWMLYQTSYELQETRLVEIAESQARLVEAIGRANDWDEKATLTLVAEAQGQYEGLGDTGEFTLARLDNGKMHFLLHHRHGSSHAPAPVSFRGKLAEPMRRSLQGELGTVVGPDYRGEIVLAAYRPVQGLNWGIVAKIDRREIRAPFVETAVVVTVVVVVLVVSGSFLLIRLGTPVLTEIEAKNRELFQERNQAREYLDIAGVLLVALDTDGNIVLVNRKGHELLGYDEGELAGRSWFQTCVPENSRDTAHGAFQQVMSGAVVPPRNAENSVLTKSGEERLIAWNNALLLNEAGKIIRTLSSGEDITERKRAEKEREGLIARLEAQNAELERFTYTVSHDLKSPLITINGYVGMLDEDLGKDASEEARQDLAQISDSVDKMTRLLKDLLELSRIGRLVNPSADIWLEDLTKEALQLTHGQIEQKGVQVVVSPDLPVVFGDRLRLLEVVQNLIDNAVKYMGDQPQPRIELFTRPSDNGTVFCVRDNGIGIATDYHQKVFGLFSQLDQNVDGSGIGLALVKRIVEVHGGRIWVESEGAGHGSTFCFTIAARGESAERQKAEPCMASH